MDKRLAADGRGLQDVHINDNFAKLSEVRWSTQIFFLVFFYYQAWNFDVFDPGKYCVSQALYLAEHKAREAVETRAKIQHELLNEQKKKKEFELRELAELARLDRAGILSDL